MQEYKLVLGLEIHIQPNTFKKVFCGCDANIWKAAPNTHTCPSCLGLPGALPVLNKQAVEKTQLLGLALNCTINKKSKFDRKHYFYPDLPKGYQISQFREPLCENGYITLDSGKKILIDRIHLEEDAAKSTHEKNVTLVDFNKGGMPLMELVTAPVFETVEEAVEFGKKLLDIVKFINVGDGDMEKGQMRLEPNISVRTAQQAEQNILPNYKVEIKNINSFKFMERAVRAEMKRQIQALEKGETLVQENRGYDENKDITVFQRFKENPKDYRYFPEPDIPVLHFTDQHINDLKAQLPKLPSQIKQQLISDFNFNDQLASQFTTYPGLELLPKLFEFIDHKINALTAAKNLLNKAEVQAMSASQFYDYLQQSQNKTTDESALTEAINKVISQNPKAVEDYKSGKQTAIMFFVGCVMKETKGKADPNILRTLVEHQLKKL